MESLSKELVALRRELQAERENRLAQEEIARSSQRKLEEEKQHVYRELSRVRGFKEIFTFLLLFFFLPSLLFDR